MMLLLAAKNWKQKWTKALYGFFLKVFGTCTKEQSV